MISPKFLVLIICCFRRWRALASVLCFLAQADWEAKAIIRLYDNAQLKDLITPPPAPDADMLDSQYSLTECQARTVQPLGFWNFEFEGSGRVGAVSCEPEGTHGRWPTSAGSAWWCGGWAVWEGWV